jgi:hypothetical protein
MWNFRFSRRRVWRWLVFWDVASCSLVETDRRSTGAYCLHHQCAASQKTVIFECELDRPWDRTTCRPVTHGTAVKTAPWRAPHPIWQNSDTECSFSEVSCVRDEMWVERVWVKCLTVLPLSTRFRQTCVWNSVNECYNESWCIVVGNWLFRSEILI